MALSKQRESPKEPNTGKAVKTVQSLFRNKKIMLCILCFAALIIATVCYRDHKPPQIGAVQTAKIKKPDGHIISIEWVSGIEATGVTHDPECPVCSISRWEEFKKAMIQLFDSLQVQVVD